MFKYSDWSVDATKVLFHRLALQLGLHKSKELLKQTEQKVADLFPSK